MKKISILIILFFISEYSLLAQLNLAYNNSAKTFNITFSYKDASGNTITPVLGPRQDQFSTTNPGYIVWYEFGDGKFTFFNSGEHAYSATPTQNALVKVSGIYEGGGRPTRVASTSGISPSTSTSGNSTYQVNSLKADENVSVISNVKDISGDDTMHFAISYRIPTTRVKGEDVWKLVFEYNRDGNSFQQTTPLNEIFDVQDISKSLNFVRTHNGEIPNYYTNKIEFTNLPPSATGDNYKTVFITLVPILNSGYNGSVRAYLVKNKETEPNATNNAEQAMENKGKGPHDPNYIQVDYYCLKPNTKHKELRYHIHFQNTGLGPSVERVRVAVKLPSYVKHNQISHRNRTCDLKANYSSKPIARYKNYASLTTDNLNEDTLYYDNVRGDSIVFYKSRDLSGGIYSGDILHGMDLTNPNYMNDPKTMGDIYFTIRLNKSYNPGDVLNATASIIFDTEEPVVTNTASIPVNRDCKENKKAKPCNCGGVKRSFWQWIKEKCE